MAKAKVSSRNDPDRFHIIQKWHEFNPQQKLQFIKKMKREGSENGTNSAALAQMLQYQHFQQQHFINQQHPSFAQGHQSNLIPIGFIIKYSEILLKMMENGYK